MSLHLSISLFLDYFYDDEPGQAKFGMFKMKISLRLFCF